MTNINKPEPLLWLGDQRGIYIPRDFANSFANRSSVVTNVDNETWSVLKSGPDHDQYWDAWNEVCDDATVTMDGVEYFIHHDGDCWLVPHGMEWSDENEFFRWPQEEDDNDDADDADDD